MTKLLIDGDLVAYRAAASAEQDSNEIAFQRMEQLLDTILEDTQAAEFKLFLSGPTNFRYRIYPEYKANRLNDPKPRHLGDCKRYLQSNYFTVTSENCEADDVMGIAQSAQKSVDETCIVSLDKDLLQVPGLHYSWYIEGGPADKRWVREARMQEISVQEGARNFYTQMLVGDPSDNIKGVPGIGKVKAAKMLAGDISPEDMFHIVREAYGFDEIMLMNGRVLHIQRNEGELWEFPYETSLSEEQGPDVTEVGA